MKRTKLIYIVSEIDKSLHFEWIAPSLNSEFKLSFILIGKPGSNLERFLKDQGICVFSITYARKSDIFAAWFRVFVILLKCRPDIVHTHLWKANLIGLTTSWIAGIDKRIYTRHHATIHYTTYPWGLKWDRINNRLATHIIAISKNIENILVYRDKAKKDKVRLIHHGFSFPYFSRADAQKKNLLYQKYNINPDHHPVIGVISRLTDWKGVQYVIPAFKKLRGSFPSAHLILANAHGDYAKEIDLLLADLPKSSVTKIVFENDLVTLYHLFDVFVHVPVDKESEAFGQTYIEPLIMGIPSIFTLSGIASEFVVNGENALVVEFRNSEQIYAALVTLLQDSKLVKFISENGRRSVSGFTIEKYMERLKNLYLE